MQALGISANGPGKFRGEVFPGHPAVACEV